LSYRQWGEERGAHIFDRIIFNEQCDSMDGLIGQLSKAFLL